MVLASIVEMVFELTPTATAATRIRLLADSNTSFCCASGAPGAKVLPKSARRKSRFSVSKFQR